MEEMKFISIPAPARGATKRLTKLVITNRFQFPPLREGRRSWMKILVTLIYFNSRPCERGDIQVNEITNTTQAISIPAPARGATDSCFYVLRPS